MPKKIPPNIGSNLIGMLIDTAQASAADLRERVSNVRYASSDMAEQKKCECILFDFEGETYLGELRGRNKDLCIDTINPNSATSRAIAARVMLDGNATKTTKKNPQEIERVKD